MSTPFIAEIKLVSFNFPPKGWAFCNGQLLPINQNQALFSLLGTSYGGNGQTNFALPDFRGRIPIHQGTGYTMGQAFGEAQHTLSMSEMPAHNHFVNAVNDIMPATAANSVPGPTKSLAAGQLAQQGGQSVPLNMYGPLANLVSLAPGAVSNYGGSQPHNNMMPYLALTFIIALQGIFPSQN